LSRSHLDFLRARASQAREEGKAATLGHVRERCQRAEVAWNDLADREERMMRDRDTRERRKAEAGEAAEMLRDRATECRDLSAQSRTQAARDAFRLLADQLDQQAVDMVAPRRR